jgi:hypothetical protein
MTPAAALIAAADVLEAEARKLRRQALELSDEPPPIMLTVKQASFLTGIPMRTLYRMAPNIGRRIGHREWLLDPEELAKLSAKTGERRQHEPNPNQIQSKDDADG